MATDLNKEAEARTRKQLAANKKLAGELKALRVARGVKASWVASKMNISKSHLSDLESGRRTWRDELVSSFKQWVLDGNNQ